MTGSTSHGEKAPQDDSALPEPEPTTATQAVHYDPFADDDESTARDIVTGSNTNTGTDTGTEQSAPLYDPFAESYGNRLHGNSDRIVVGTVPDANDVVEPMLTVAVPHADEDLLVCEEPDDIDVRALVAAPLLYPVAATPVDATPAGPDATATQDKWLDTLRTGANAGAARGHAAASLVKRTFRGPWTYTRKVASFLASSPGLMTLVTLIVMAATLAAGMSMSHTSDERQHALQQLITTTEPVSYSAHNLYTSLSVADTTATTDFAQPGAGNINTRRRYDTAIRRAADAAAAAAVGLSDTFSYDQKQLATIQRQLPVYTGLVETARTNHRLGNPVGAAYLAEASDVMRTTILPAAEELFTSTTKQVQEEQAAMTTPPWVPISGLVAAVLMLLFEQRWLAHKTRRRINKGFFLATFLLTVALVWTCGSSIMLWDAGTKGFEEASTPLSSLTTARIHAQQARTGETLALVRRHNTEGDAEFATAADHIEKALAEYKNSNLATTSDNSATIASAERALSFWRHAHARFEKAQADGNFDEASAIALGDGSRYPTPGDGTSASAFDALDHNTAVLIADAREAMRTYLNDGLKATHQESTLVLVLSILAALSAAAGIRPRLQEYL